MLFKKNQKPSWKRELTPTKKRGQGIIKFFKAIIPTKSKPTKDIILRNRPNSKKKQRVWIILGIVALGLLVYGAVWLNTRNFLMLKNIIVATTDSGTQDVGIIQDIIKKQWQEKRFGLIPQNFYFAFNTGEAIKNIRAILAVEDIQIQTFFPSVVRVELKQLPAKVIATAGARFYAVSARGDILKELTDMKTAPNAYPNVFFAAETNFTIGQNIIKEQVIDFLARAHLAMSQLTLAKLADHWEYVDGPRPEVNLKTKEGFIIKFDPFDKPEDEIQNVELFLTQQLKTLELRKGLEYIDARFGNKIFYK